MPPSSNWSAPRAKVQLKLSIQRLRLLGAKKAQLAKVTRREIAGLLEKRRIETARIKVEGVMGEDTMVELLEVLELYCELLLARFGLLETVREVDPGVAEAVAGIVHAAPRTELKELHTLRDMLMSKYGRDFSLACMDNTDEIVSTRVTSKLAISQPPKSHVDLYLFEIAKTYGVDWRPEGFPDPNEPTPLSDVVPTALSLPADPPLPTTPTKPHPASLPPFPSTPPVDPSAAPRTVVLHTNLHSPAIQPPQPPAPPATASAPTGSKEDAFEALTRRFAELKKR